MNSENDDTSKSMYMYEKPFFPLPCSSTIAMEAIATELGQMGMKKTNAFKM